MLTQILSACVFHYSRVERPVDSGKPSGNFRSIPMKLELRRSEYMTSEFNSRLLKSQYIRINGNANVHFDAVFDQIRRNELEKQTTVPFCLSLGFLPLLSNRRATVKFILRDETTGQEIRQYDYEVSHYLVAHVLAAPLALVNLFQFDSMEIKDPIGTWHDRATAEKVALARFEQDVARDQSDPDFQKHFYTLEKSKRVYLLLPVENDVAPSNRRYQVYTNLESGLLSAGATLVERSRLDKLLKEQALTETGITQAQGTKIGTLLAADYLLIPDVSWFEEIRENPATKKLSGGIKVSVRCVKVDTGEIIWKRDERYGAYLPETEGMIDGAVNSLVYSIKSDNVL